METGLTYSSTVQVNSTNTALALGSGDMEGTHRNRRPETNLQS